MNMWRGRRTARKLFGWRWRVPQNERDKKFKSQKNMKYHMEMLETKLVVTIKKVKRYIVNVLDVN